jgi:hypothetical protein
MMIHSLEYSERVQQDDKKEEEVMVQIEKGSVQEKKFQKMAKVDHDSWETWLEIIKTVDVNQRLKVPLYVETQEIQEIHLIHIWIAESQTKKHLYCTRGAENFDLCLLCPNWTKLLPYGFFAVWLLRLDFTV